MPLRNAIPLHWKPKGLTDSIDGTNSFNGAMAALQNLIPNPSTPEQWVPRPAAVQKTNFDTFTTPAGVTALLTVGDIAYGMIASATFPGKDQPFAYNLATGNFEVISGPSATNLPNTQATTGDWTPPTMAVIGTRVMTTHPGFAGTGSKIGWLDISGFNLTTLTGDTHTNTLIDALSSSPIAAGAKPGMLISGANIQAGTTIVALTAATITLSLPTTGSTGSVALTIVGGTATAPQWAAGDTNTNNLAAIPVSVSQFSGRAYYAVSNGVVFSDAGNATQVTNASQAITFQNGLPVTALGGLPLNTTAGGIVQALICFQGCAAMWQITGDSSTSDLLVNILNVRTGTLAPNTICGTPLGLSFVAPDGVRIIDFQARVSEPIGAYGQGVNVPFLFALAPSRMAAAFNQNTLRVTVQNGSAQGQPTYEYWLHFSTKSWSGPHTFPAALIQPWNSATNTFVMVGVGIDAKLWQSDVQVSTGSAYTENGVALTWAWETVMLPDNDKMTANAIVESSIFIALPGGQQMTMQALNDSGAVLNTIFLTGTGTVAPIWGAFTWGLASWGSSAMALQLPLDWTVPLVFKQMQFRLTGNSVSGVVIGNIYMHYQTLGYMLRGVA